MLPLILTGLAGIAIGVVIMRLTQSGSAPAPAALSDAPINEGAPGAPDEPADADSASSSGLAGLLGRFSKNQLLFGAAGLLASLSVIAYFARSTESGSAAGGTGAALTAAAKPAGALDDVDTMITRLAERLKTDTSDGEGFRMLGWSYVNTGKSAEAVKAYETAVKLLPARADVHAGYGEAMVAVAKDIVTPQAKAQFDAAIKLDAAEPRARFFQGLYKSQNGKEQEALSDWISLANASSAELPWQADVRQRIDKLAKKLGVDVSGKLRASKEAPAATASPFAPTGTGGPDAAAVAAASKLPATEQQGMINNMVDGLAAKLQANPDNLDGWVKLIRSRVVLKDAARAKDDLAMARKALASDPAKLGQINALASELGL
jgi:cytochrome c-type biogenesis protein CcmH